MNVIENVSSDFDDSDIFVEQHIKSSPKKCLGKNVTLCHSFVNKNETKPKKGKVRKYSGDSCELESKKKRRYSSSDVEVLKKKSESASYIISKKNSKFLGCDKIIFSDKLKTNDTNNGHGSSKLNLKSHKITSKNLPEKKPVTKSLLKSIDATKDNYSEEKKIRQEIFLDSDEKQSGNSALLCFFLKEIIKYEMEKQSDLNMKSSITVEKLLSECEYEIFEKFFNLEENACKVFVRMLGRKKGWHRVSTMSYSDIGTNLKTEFEILQQQNFIDTKIENEDMKTQMALLRRDEVLSLCKEFNIPLKFIKNSKNDLINSLIENSKKQRSVFDMFKGKNSNKRLDCIKHKIKNLLGLCVRINNQTFRAFYKILVLFSFAHYSGEEDKRFQNELFLFYQVHENIIKFPDYKLSPTVVFQTAEDFENYEKSLLLQGYFEAAVTNKNHDEFVSAFNKAKYEFKKLLNNTEYVKNFLNLEPFLRKFSAGTVYAKILTNCCKKFKTKTDKEEIVNTIQLLLDQNIFLSAKRGEWYEILSMAKENQKQTDAAAEVLISGLKDPLINEVQKLSLQLRGQSILKKKTCGIENDQLKKILYDVCLISVHEPSSIEIKGKALEGNESGHKSVYIQEFDNKKLYFSVEERAILHYKLNGFTKGYHSEGFIVQSLYFLFFFDVIYETSPLGVFQSRYQEAPLDFYSTYFYKNRKEVIDQLLTEMLHWNDEQVKVKINDIYSKNYKTTCVMKWNDEFNPELFCEIVKCISMPKLVLIFQRFLKSFRVSLSGFPDLTLWNPDTNKCKFVEVKGPSDKLSCGQRLWLDYLKSIELDCEVCNVRNISSKSLS